MIWNLLHTLRLPLLILACAAVSLLVPWFRRKRSVRQWRRESLIGFRCSGCLRLLLVDEELAGKWGRCKACGAILSIPRSTRPARKLRERLKPALAEATDTVRSAISLEGPCMNSFLRTFNIVFGLLAASTGIAMLIYNAYYFFLDSDPDMIT